MYNNQNCTCSLYSINMYKFQKDQPKVDNDDSESILYVNNDEYYEENDFEDNDLQKVFEQPKLHNDDDSESILYVNNDEYYEENDFEDNDLQKEQPKVHNDDDYESILYVHNDEYYEENDFENNDLQKGQRKFQNEEDSESISSCEDDTDSTYEDNTESTHDDNDDDYFEEIEFENDFEKDQPEIQDDDISEIMYEDVDDVYCEELDFENIDFESNNDEHLMPYTPPPSTPAFQLGTSKPKLNPYFRERLTSLIKRSTCTWSDVELIDYVLDNHGNIKEVLKIELLSFKEQLTI